MPRGEKGRHFKIGNPGGPGGKRLTPEQKMIKNMTQQDVADLGRFILSTDREGLKAAVNDPKATLMKLCFAKFALNATQGDTKAFETIMSRILGKVTEKHEIVNTSPLVLAYTAASLKQKENEPIKPGNSEPNDVQS